MEQRLVELRAERERVASKLTAWIKPMDRRGCVCVTRSLCEISWSSVDVTFLRNCAKLKTCLFYSTLDLAQRKFQFQSRNKDDVQIFFVFLAVCFLRRLRNVTRNTHVSRRNFFTLSVSSFCIFLVYRLIACIGSKWDQTTFNW